MKFFLSIARTRLVVLVQKVVFWCEASSASFIWGKLLTMEYVRCRLDTRRLSGVQVVTLFELFSALFLKNAMINKFTGVTMRAL